MDIVIRDALAEIETRLANVVMPSVTDAALADVVEFARAFVKLRELKDEIDETFKAFDAFYTKTKDVDLPLKFDEAKVPTVTLDEGFRVTVAHNVRASVKKDKKQEAMDWLRANGLGDIVSETINASTLAAVAKSMTEENRELDPDLFSVYILPTTSVTRTGK